MAVGNSLFHIRGESFREEYTRLGELRSLVPPTCKFMALTATASRSTREKITRSLVMWKPITIHIPPQKKNILYCVKTKDSIESMVQSICCSLREIGAEYPRKIIFCKRYTECTEIYHAFKTQLKGNFTHPPGAPDIVKYRLVDMYTRCTESSVKENILQSFCKVQGTLRIVIATIAFGMGLDCPNIREIIHWGPSSDIESYIQETGRAGRDGCLSHATLLHGSGDRRYASPEMMLYVENTTHCRRQLLFSDFDQSDDHEKPCKQCHCCDICRINCRCDTCVCGMYIIRNNFIGLSV